MKFELFDCFCAWNEKESLSGGEATLNLYQVKCYYSRII